MFLLLFNITSVLFVTLAVVLYFYFVYKYNYWKKRGVDFITPSFPFGNTISAFAGRTNMNLLIQKWHKEIKGPFGGVYLINKPALVIKDPDIIKCILVKDFNYFCDRGMYVDEEAEPTSGHLFRLNGNRWGQMRAKISPAFTIGKIKLYFDTINKAAQQWEEILNCMSEDAPDINVTEQTTRYTADSIASVIFGIEVNSFKERNNYWWAIVRALFGKCWYIRNTVFTLVMFLPEYLRYFKIRTIQHKTNMLFFNLVNDVIKYREENELTRNDFMQFLIQLKNQGVINDKDRLDDKHVYEQSRVSEGNISLDEVTAMSFTMFFAGLDTSALTIAYCLYELAKHPKIQRRLLEDIDKSLAKYSGEVCYESIMEMTYLQNVLSETLRMYPVLAYLKRVAVKDYQLPDSNVVIEKDTVICISLLGLHYDEVYFPEPHSFNPNRFSTENKGNIRSFTYMPFGDGPRFCIGKRLGYLQSAVGIVHVLRNHYVSKSPRTIERIDYEPCAFPNMPTRPIILTINKRYL